MISSSSLPSLTRTSQPSDVSKSSALKFDSAASIARPVCGVAARILSVSMTRILPLHCGWRARVLSGFADGSRLQAAGADHAPEQPEAEHGREHETDEREEVDAGELRPGRREDSDQAGADQAADDDQRDDEPVEGDVDLARELVQALVHEADLDLAVADLLEEVVHLVR